MNNLTTHTYTKSQSHYISPFMSNSLSGCVLSARLGENFPIWFTIPRKGRTSPTFVGTLTFWMAMTFLGSGLIPVPSMQCPKNFTDFCANQHFSEFSVTPASCSHWSTFSSLSSCSSCVLQWTRTSSIIHMTPARLLKVSDIRRWKCSGADEIPKGIRWKQNRPKDRGICQNPELASSFVNTFAPASCASVWSTTGSGWHSLFTLSFSLVSPHRSSPCHLGWERPPCLHTTRLVARP